MRKHRGRTSRRDKCVTPTAVSPPGAPKGRFVGGHQPGRAGCKPPPLFKRGVSFCSSQRQRQREQWGPSPHTYLPRSCTASKLNCPPPVSSAEQVHHHFGLAIGCIELRWWSAYEQNPYFFVSSVVQKHSTDGQHGGLATTSGLPSCLHAIDWGVAATDRRRFAVQCDLVRIHHDWVGHGFFGGALAVGRHFLTTCCPRPPALLLWLCAFLASW